MKIFGFFKNKKKTKLQNFKSSVKRKLESSSLSDVQRWGEDLIRKGEVSDYDFYFSLFFFLKDTNIPAAIFYGSIALDIKYNENLDKAIKIRIIRLKNEKCIDDPNCIYNVKKFHEYIESNSYSDVEQWMIKACSVKPEIELALYKIFFNKYKDIQPDLAMLYGSKAIQLGADEKFSLVFYNRKNKLEKFSSEQSCSKSLEQSIFDLISQGDNDRAINEFENISDEYVQLSVAKKVFKINKDSDVVIACQFIKPVLHLIDDVGYLKVIAARMYSIKNMEIAEKLYSRCLESDQSPIIYERFVLSYVAAHKDTLISEYKEAASLQKHIEAALPACLDGSLIEESVLWITYLCLKGSDQFVAQGIDIAKKLVARGNKEVAFDLSKQYFEQGLIQKALHESGLDETIDTHKHQTGLLIGYQSLLNNGFPMPDAQEGHKGEANKSLYTLYNSLPVHSAGYATRAHGLMLELRKHGFDFSAMTRRGYPQDLRKFRDREDCKVEYVDGIAYHRLPTATEGHGFIPLNEYLTKYAQHIIEHAKANNVGVLHSASNFVNGVATNYAAKALGIKSIYEVRGLWEITRISRQPEWKGTEHYEMTKRLETESALYADQVITITQALKDEMIRRGIGGGKITVVPNGVDTSRFEILPRDIALEEKLQLQNQMVIGYVGSMVDYEGLDLLIQAAARLKENGLSGFKLLMVGDGVVKPELEMMVEENNLQDVVIFTGRVSHDEVESYYSLIDICPFPRKALPVCEMVSPLKPFEAMAMGKAVVSSNVAALAEIVQDGVTGLLHQKDCANDLADKLQIMIENPSLRKIYGQAARDWVVAERDWKVLAKRVEGIYRKLQQQDMDEKAA